MILRECTFYFQFILYLKLYVTDYAHCVLAKGLLRIIFMYYMLFLLLYLYYYKPEESCGMMLR